MVVLTGANGFVGSRICEALAERGARVRAIVRRAGTGPGLPGIGLSVGVCGDLVFAGRVVWGAWSVAMASRVPSARAARTAATSDSVRSGGLTL